MIPLTVHQIWLNWGHGWKIPMKYSGFTKTWELLMPKCNFKLWGDDDVKNVLVKFPVSYQEMYHNMSFIQRCDLLRLMILYCFGGFYVDMDVEPKRAFDELFSKSLVLSKNVRGFTNYFIGAEKRHPFVFAMIKTIYRKHLQPLSFLSSVSRHHWVIHTTGPEMMNEVVNQNPRLLLNATYLEPWETSTKTFFGTRIDAPQGNVETAICDHLCDGNWLKFNLKEEPWIVFLLIPIVIVCVFVTHSFGIVI